MRSIPRLVKVLLFVDLAACLLRSSLWMGQLSDFPKRGVITNFPILAPAHLTIGAAYITAFLIGDVLLLRKSEKAFPFAWVGFVLLVLHLCIGSALHFVPSSPISAANSGELAGILLHDSMRVLFNFMFFLSLLRLKRVWQSA